MHIHAFSFSQTRILLENGLVEKLIDKFLFANTYTNHSKIIDKYEGTEASYRQYLLNQSPSADRYTTVCFSPELRRSRRPTAL